MQKSASATPSSDANEEDSEYESIPRVNRDSIIEIVQNELAKRLQFHIEFEENLDEVGKLIEKYLLDQDFQGIKKLPD